MRMFDVVKRVFFYMHHLEVAIAGNDKAKLYEAIENLKVWNRKLYTLDLEKLSRNCWYGSHNSRISREAFDLILEGHTRAMRLIMEN